MEIIGHKTQALFDLWSVCHFFAGVAIGNFFTKVQRNNKTVLSYCPKSKILPFTLTWVLALAYSWEFIEFAMESGYAGDSVSYWLQGQEHWLNRLASDPFLVIAGYIFGFRFQPFIWPARVMLIAWLSLFVFIFPHSMGYLQ